MKVTYNNRTKVFQIIFTDPLKKFQGDKHPYTRIQRKWKGIIKPNRYQQASAKNDLISEALRRIDEGEKEIERLKRQQKIQEAISEIEEISLDEKLPFPIKLPKFRRIVRECLLASLESVNWEKFINWNTLFRALEDEMRIEMLQLDKDEEKI